MQSRGKVPTVVSRIIKATVIAAVLAVVINSLPDIKRYIEIRQM
jgi:hypothetical protein